MMDAYMNKAFKCSLLALKTTTFKASALSTSQCSKLMLSHNRHQKTLMTALNDGGQLSACRRGC